MKFQLTFSIHIFSSFCEMGSLFSPSFFFLLLFLLSQPFFLILTHCSPHASLEYISAIGDPGMKSPNVRVAFEAWNFCNEVGAEAPHMGSPRLADCADLRTPFASGMQFFWVTVPLFRLWFLIFINWAFVWVYFSKYGFPLLEFS